VNLPDRLLESDEPSIRLQVRLGIDNGSETEVTDMREQARQSPRVATLLSERNADGLIETQSISEVVGRPLGAGDTGGAWLSAWGRRADPAS
jgi:hypothetical protein